VKLLRVSPPLKLTNTSYFHFIFGEEILRMLLQAIVIAIVKAKTNLLRMMYFALLL
jgi:hypothetical protein